MIFYFSGTGNSKYVAKCLQQSDEAFINIADALHNKELVYKVSSEEKIGFVFPVYFYTLPSIVQQFINSVSIEGASYTYAIITCGGGIGQAGAKLSKKLQKKNIQLNYLKELKMPDNSMLFYQIPDKQVAKQRLENAKIAIEEMKQDISQRRGSKVGSITVISDLMEIGYKLCQKTKKYYAEDSCNGCGLCERNCPEHVIELVDGNPKWVKERCSKCSACINRCPQKAIQYGKGTKKRNRYVCEEI